VGNPVYRRQWMILLTSVVVAGMSLATGETFPAFFAEQQPAVVGQTLSASAVPVPVLAQSAPALGKNLNEIIAAAAREGTIDLTWSASVMGDADVARQCVLRVDPRRDARDFPVHRLVRVVARSQTDSPEREFVESDSSAQPHECIDHGVHGAVSASRDERADTVVQCGTNRTVVAGRISLYNPRLE